MERQKISDLFKDVGKHYKENDLAELELRRGHDVHAFYRLCKNPKKVIHVQGYPGLSNEEQARVYARLMDYDKMNYLALKDEVSTDNGKNN